MWTSRCPRNMLKSHACDLNSDTNDFQPILKSQTVFWSKTLTTDLKICWNISVLQTLTWDSTVLQERPPMAHLWNSWGERLLLWQCRLIWEALFTPKSKTPEGRMVGLSGHPNTTPQVPGREAENPGSGLPPAQIQTGSWVIWGAHMRLSSQRSSFQGNVALSPSR